MARTDSAQELAGALRGFGGQDLIHALAAVIALVTAFDAFGGDTENSSATVLRLLPDMLGETLLVKKLLPTSFARAWPLLKRELDRQVPDIVLLMGQASERSRISLERYAVNWQDARIPDNDGEVPQDQSIIAGAPYAHQATLSLDRCIAALNKAGIPAEISDDAGRFVCNATFFHLLHEMDVRAKGLLAAGFAHLPRFAGQAAKTGALDPACATQAIIEILKAAAGV